MIYLTADWHLNHHFAGAGSILEYCERPFKDIEENNRTIIDNYNNIVTNDDILFFVGDVALYTSKISLKLIIDRIKGHKKILIRGNHDRFGKNTYLKCGFDRVYKSYDIGRIHICHRPSKARKRAWLNIVAHAHQHWKIRENMVNVGVDVWNFKPISLTDLMKVYKTHLSIIEKEK